MTVSSGPAASDAAASGLGAVVLAGGRARRFGGGVDKLGVLLDGEPLLGHVLRAVPAGAPVVVVGPRPDDVGHLPGHDRLRWVLERRRFGGPVPALATGERELPDDVSRVLVLAGDQPFAAVAVTALLIAVESESRVPEETDPRPITDAWVAVDADGVRQPLLAVYARSALRRALGEVGAAGEAGAAREEDAREQSGGHCARSGASGPSMRRLLVDLAVREVPAPAGSTTDVDTRADLDAARRRRDDRYAPRADHPPR